jgi:hypothetical protein
MDEGMRPGIILIGPIWAGKSTIAALLAERLGLPQVSMDDTSWGYYEEVGFDRSLATQFEQQEDQMGFFRYIQPFLAHAVERHLAEYPRHVTDFGAVHSVHEDPAALARVQGALAPYSNVVLLLPSPDSDRSIAVLRERERAVGATWLEKIREKHGVHLNEWYVRHPSNRQLGKIVVYTEGRTPEETRDEVLGRLVLPKQDAGNSGC